MTTTLYLHPADIKACRGYGFEALTMRKLRRNILLLHGPRPVTTYRVERGHFGVLGFRADEADIGTFSDRRKAKRVARKAAAELGMIPRAVWRGRMNLATS